MVNIDLFITNTIKINYFFIICITKITFLINLFIIIIFVFKQVVKLLIEKIIFEDKHDEAFCKLLFHKYISRRH